MCGRISQFSDIREYVATLCMKGALVNSVGDAPLERYNVAPTTQVALLHLQDETLHADLVRWGWRPHWAKDRAAPINARVEKVAHGAFFRAIWPHRAITPVDNWNDCSVDLVHDCKSRREDQKLRLLTSLQNEIVSELQHFPTGNKKPRRR